MTGVTPEQTGAAALRRRAAVWYSFSFVKTAFFFSIRRVI
jgi:hypothetical protein